MSSPLLTVTGHANVEGRFQVELPPGRYHVRVDLKDQYLAATPDEIEVPPSGLTALALRLEGDGSISGKVVGCPAPASHFVQLRRWNGTRWEWRGVSKPQDDGAFRGRWLTPGRWQIHHTTSYSRPDDGWCPPLEIEVAPGRESSGLVLQWRPCPTIELLLRGAGGAPVSPSVLITAFGDMGSARFAVEPDLQGRATTRRLAPGRWRIRAGEGPTIGIEVLEGSNPPIDLLVK